MLITTKPNRYILLVVVAQIPVRREGIWRVQGKAGIIPGLEALDVRCGGIGHRPDGGPLAGGIAIRRAGDGTLLVVVVMIRRRGGALAAKDLLSDKLDLLEVAAALGPYFRKGLHIADDEAQLVARDGELAAREENLDGG